MYERPARPQPRRRRSPYGAAVSPLIDELDQSDQVSAIRRNAGLDQWRLVAESRLLALSRLNFSILLVPPSDNLTMLVVRHPDQCQDGSTWMRLPSRRTSDDPTSASCKSRVLTFATPVNSLAPGPKTMCILVLVLPIHFPL
jgi:hypothetical protein